MPPKKFVMKKTQVPASAFAATYLIIVESPSKCSKIESFLGKEYACIASMGHIRHIAGLGSIDVKNQFAINFDILPDKKDHVQVLKSTVAKFSKKNVIIATDDDREGEAIAWHICEVCGLNVATTQRILFHEITEPAIKAAVKNPTNINMDLVRAAHARQVLDMLVGFKVSPLLWKYLYCNKKNSLSAGRCQTPALRLVYDNMKEREATCAKPCYKITAIFFQQRLSFCLQIDSDSSSITQPVVQQFLEKSKTHAHILSVGKSRETVSSPPKPFNTSQLLQTAFNRLRMSPKETMANCQKLYQDGLITYMRTDSTKYAAEFLQEAGEYIGQKYGPPALGDFAKIEQKDAANPHEAIRVTHIETVSIGGTDQRLVALYALIWRNTVESCMAPAKYEATTLTISAPTMPLSSKESVGTIETYYKHVLEIPLFLGWKLVGTKKEMYEREPDTRDDEDVTQDSVIMTQEEGRGLLLYLQAIKGPVKYQQIAATVVMRNMHTHYTEASLIKRLEDYGIGRPSTFAFLVETILERGYVKCQDVAGIEQKITELVLTDNNIRATVKEKTFGEEKKKLVIQPVGIMTVEFLIEHFGELFSYDYTKHMELELDIISKGERTWHELCEKCNGELKEWMKPAFAKKQVFHVIQECEDDEDAYVVSIGQYGPVLKRTVVDPSGNKKTEYRPIKRGFSLNMDTLKQGKYKLEELMEIVLDLGEYEGFPLLIKEGKYGTYVKWGENTLSLKGVELDRDSILNHISNRNENSIPSSTRVINENLSIRVGKFGPYVFYKTAQMKKPKFYPMKKVPFKYTDCDLDVLLNWINTTYQLNEKIQH